MHFMEILSEPSKAKICLINQDKKEKKTTGENVFMT